VDHNFRWSDFTVGIEEELMILDAGTLDLVNAIEDLLGPADHGDVKPELMESVLEISTDPCRTIAEAGGQLRELRRSVRERAEARGYAIGSAGTHPFARWEDQRIVARPRYRDLISALRFVARQELIFGMHVHVGLDDPETAIFVANGMRLHVPALLALSANSPYWRGDVTGLASTRMPIFRAFPRVGIPPYYRDWADYRARIGFQVESGVIEDYTYLWYDVRPHPRLGTVEIRAMDSQTRLEHTVGIAALVQSLVRKLATDREAGREPIRAPYEMLDENRWLAARHGLGGEVVDLPSTRRITTKALVRRLLDEVADHARDLGCDDELDGVRDLLDRGNGAQRQVVVYEANRDMRELLAEIVEATGE
jgi:glutamate---cysteine ligase / carboxylate-amine ligase